VEAYIRGARGGQCGVVFTSDDHPGGAATDHYRGRYRRRAPGLDFLVVDIVPALNARSAAAVVTNRSASLVVASITAATRRQNESERTDDDALSGTYSAYTTYGRWPALMFYFFLKKTRI